MTVPERVLLVADFGLPHDLAEQIAPLLAAEVCVTSVRLPADDDGELLVPADLRRRDGELVVLLTDSSRTDEDGPVVAELHPADGTGLVSLPSLGATRLRRRAAAAVDCVIRELSGATGHPRLGPFGRREGDTVKFVAGAGFGRLRVLAGMVRANRPWRLLPHLSKAFAAALAILAYALLHQTIWQLAGTVGTWRLVVTTVLAIGIMVVWLIVNHEMWERPAEPSDRARVAQFNAATVATLVIGVLFLYAGLLVLGFVTDRVLLDNAIMESATRKDATLAQHLGVVWLASSIATVAGAVGTGFESRDAVRQAAYGYRQRERLERAPQRERD